MCFAGPDFLARGLVGLVVLFFGGLALFFFFLRLACVHQLRFGAAVLASHLPAVTSVLLGSGLSLLLGIGFLPVCFPGPLGHPSRFGSFFGFCGVLNPIA